ncbi:MAG: hypothetical protein WDM85_16045 [Caulobacteraceae bacterium]
MRRIICTLGLLPPMVGQADAAGADCRRIPVYSAPCFSQAKPHPGCVAISHAKAPCFVVHGILHGSNGVPAVRLWRSGTKRVLGIVGGDGDPAGGRSDPRAARQPDDDRHGGLVALG